jgi:hypothetical protein
MAEQGHALPIYRSWPSEPYQVIGAVRLENPNQTWDEGDLGQAARKAKQHRADAIIVRRGSEFGVSKIVGANDDPSIATSGYTSAIVE